MQTGGGVRDEDAADALFDAGVARVVLGTAALEDPGLVRRLAARHPVAVGLDARGREVAVRGWLEGSGQDLLRGGRGASATPGVAALVVTEIGRDGTLEGPDLAGLAAVLAATAIPVIASGGVGIAGRPAGAGRAVAGGRACPGRSWAGRIYEGALHRGRRRGVRCCRRVRAMNVARVIPCLDVDAGRVVKGVNFVDLRDAGDPVELAARYDAEGADELVFLDITASSDARDTIVDVVRHTAEEVFIPFTVGGGIRTVEDARRLLRAGADKVVGQHRGGATDPS